ncbi:Interferon regulatory factor 3 [Oryzias melastigma]|uniref:Interferon regulatory factor 3 n=1 Tax=Oryzias melastigma TaxID=30732 RepID=A0A834FIH1_ORYME|nr:Interferon regulatory factor 3 [Oryzias melastigma]
MAHSKPLLIPWLRDKIDSGKYQGVSWTNAEKTEFSIPWKHGLRGDSTDTDVLIFKAWAEVSGNGRAQGEPSVWKRNFRSALRAKGFKLVFDNKKDDANPHKIFHWPEESSSGASSAAGSQELTDNNVFDTYIIQDDSNASPDILQECLKGLNIDPEAGRVVSTSRCSRQRASWVLSSRQSNFLSNTEGITGFEPPPEQQQLQNHGLIGGHPLPGATAGSSNVWTQFRILMYYRGVKVSEKLVENEAGFRLVYRPDLFDSALDSQTGLSMVSLPIPGDMLDKTQAKLTQRILDTLGEGLEVGVSGNLVYGRRRGDTKVFWSFSKFDSSRIPQEVSKLNPDALFLWKNFIQGIIDFSYGGDCPPCSLFFCLGEKWPDPENRPWTEETNHN